MEAEQVEELICIVSSMERDALTERLMSFKATFPVDFTREFLNHQPVDRLRHILLALCLQSRRLPVAAEAA